MWLILALLSAFFTSLLDISVKKIITKVNVYVVAWASAFFSLPYLYAFLLIQGVPPLGSSFGKALTVSTVLLIFASIFYFKAIKYSDLSISMPMLTFTPLFLLITSPLILGEFPGFLGIIGIISIVFGSYVLHFQERSKGYLEPFKFLVRKRGPRYMLLVALIYSVGANYDKIGVTNSSPVMWVVALATVLACALGIIMMQKTKNIGLQIKSEWPTLAMIGLFNALALIFQMTAIEMTLVPYLVAVKRTSVFMTSLFGFILFKEKGMKERLTGALLMIAGVFMIALFQ